MTPLCIDTTANPGGAVPAGSTSLSVSVLIVNFRTLDLTIEAVESALREPEAKQIVVVDNDSGDGSGETLARRYETQGRVLILCSPSNVGFGSANNLAAAAATEPLLFLLNSDATFRSGCLKELCARWSVSRDIGVLAPSVYVTATGKLQRDAIGVFPTACRIILQTSKAEANPIRPDFVSGCALMISRKTFHDVGGFDSEIFMYFEDVLLCWHVRKLGLRIERCLPAAVDHRGGSSYKTARHLRSDYFGAQRTFLKRIGEPRLARIVIAVTQWPTLWIRLWIRRIVNHRAGSAVMRQTPCCVARNTIPKRVVLVSKEDQHLGPIHDLAVSPCDRSPLLDSKK